MSRTARPRSRCSTRSARAAPHFAHEALLVAAEGKLSKRLGSTGVDALREAGIEPLALLSLLARLGTSQPVEASAEPRRARRRLRLRHLRPRPGAFRPRRGRAAQRQTAPPDSTSPTSPTACPRARARPTGRLLRGNVAHLGEVADWLPVLHGDIAAARSRARRQAVPRRRPPTAAAALDWSADPWRQLTDALKAATGRKGKRPVPPAAPRADRPRLGPRNGRAAADHRPRPRHRPPDRRRRLTAPRCNAAPTSFALATQM